MPMVISDAYRFFLPLMLMAELMMFSHAVITAFLARMPDPAFVLAAYSVAFHTHAVLGSPLWAMQIIVLSFIRDRASVLRLAKFALIFLALVTAAQLLLGLTGVGDVFFQRVFGVRPEVAAQAKLCMVVSIAVLPFSILRALCYGLMMLRRRTFLVALGTVVRLLGLAVILALLTRNHSGAVVGVTALTACIAFESLYAAVLGWRFYRDLEPQVQPPPGYLELWRFSWPIFFMQTAESGMTFTVNFFLGRLASPELALAAYAVLDSVVRVLLSPLRNLVHTTQTLVRSRADTRLILIFATHMALVFAAIMGLLMIPWVEHLALTKIMGLTANLIADIRPGFQLGALLALAMAGAGVFRGLLIASHNTGFIAVSAVLRIAVVAVLSAAALWLGMDNGAQLGIMALIAAFAAEALLLGARLRRLDRAPRRLFVDPVTTPEPPAPGATRC